MSNGSTENGSLIVYRGKPNSTIVMQVEVWINRDKSKAVISNLVQRNIDGEVRYAAAFPSLPAGTHTVNYYGQRTDVTIFDGHLSEVDMRG